MSVRNSPCYQCTERTVGCHSTCTSYISWQAERDELLAKDRARNVHLQSSTYSLGDIRLSLQHFSARRDR